MNQCIVHSNNHGGHVFSELTQEEWPHKWANKIMYYDVTDTCRTLDFKKVKKALNFAMTTWDLEIDIKFHPIWRTSGLMNTNLKIDFESAEENTYFEDKPTVLAYAYFPGQGSVSGKVVFNNEYIWSLDGKPISGKDAKAKGWVNMNTSDNVSIKTWNIIHVLIHELGHSLGLKHDAHNDTKDVMDPYYSGKLELSEWDILRIRLKYPARVFSRWYHYGRLKRWLKLRKSRL